MVTIANYYMYIPGLLYKIVFQDTLVHDRDRPANDRDRPVKYVPATAPLPSCSNPARQARHRHGTTALSTIQCCDRPVTYNIDRLAEGWQQAIIFIMLQLHFFYKVECQY